MSFNGSVPKNVLGSSLRMCSRKPLTGFYRNGLCETGPEDRGQHTICVQVTEEFLDFSKKKGNDLSTPVPGGVFSGLKPGDCWCLCALRWKEAFEEGAAPSVHLESTHESALEVIALDDLLAHQAKK